MTTNTNTSPRPSSATAARNVLDALVAADDSGDTYALVRELLIDSNADLDTDDDAAANAPLIFAAMIEVMTDQHTLSLMRLDYSLCPVHAIDYAICFDDDDSACASVRACFPNHDT